MWKKLEVSAIRRLCRNSASCSTETLAGRVCSTNITVSKSSGGSKELTDGFGIHLAQNQARRESADLGVRGRFDHGVACPVALLAKIRNCERASTSFPARISSSVNTAK